MQMCVKVIWGVGKWGEEEKAHTGKLWLGVADEL